MNTQSVPSVLLDQPLVSAVVPAYNAARYIRRTLHSLVNQTYPNMEIIVVDDGSSDATVQIVQTMASSHPRIRLLQQRHSGVAAARNRGVHESHAEFIAPVDADDIWYPQAAEKLVNRLLQSGDDVGVAYGWSITIDEAGVPDGDFRCSMIEGQVFNSLFAHNFIGNASATMIRRTFFDQVDGYDSQLREEGAQGCEDWDLYLRIAEHCQFRVVPEFLVGYRKVATSMSANATSMATSHSHIMRKLAQRRPGIPKMLQHLAASSLYLYFAQECQRRQSPYESLTWVRRALTDGHIYTLMRPACYVLLLKILFSIIGIRPSRKVSNEARQRHIQNDNEMRMHIGITKFARIKSRIFMQNIMHFFVTRLPIG